MPEPTSERLAKALERDGAPQWIVDRARALWYDDFLAPDEAPDLPKAALVEDLMTIGLRKFAQRVAGGEFDNTPEEGAAWWEQEKKKLSPEQAAFADALLKTPFPFVGIRTNLDVDRKFGERGK